MRKLVLLIGILIIGIALVGCQQAGLTEEDVRSIVREEVSRQLAGTQIKDIVGQEVTGQLAGLNSLVRQEVTTQLTNIDDIVGEEVTGQLAGLDDIVGREVTGQLATVRDIVGQEVTSHLGSIDVLTVSQLQITNSDGKLVAMLTGLADDRGMLGLYDAETGYILTYLGVTAGGNARLNLSGSNGIAVASIGASITNDGFISLNDRYGGWTFVAP